MDYNAVIAATPAFSQAQKELVTAQQTLQQQRVIRLHYLGGMPFADIAVVLDLSAGRVAQLHRQALALLRQHLPDARDN